MDKKLLMFQQKMKKEGLNPLAIDIFSSYYQKLVSGDAGLISRETISPLGSGSVKNYETLDDASETNIGKFAILKLNGGLGTSMGLKKAKSLLPVKGSMTFLDIIAKQILILRQKSKVNVPFLLMNSFNTQADTIAHLAKYKNLQVEGLPLDFLQNKFPKILADGFEPFEDEDDKLTWNPPGHGEVYTSLFTSGILDKLLARGIKYLFISNSDNLGSEYDAKILNYFASSKLDFMMEVCTRTQMDKKGGHLAQNKDGRLVLREVAQTPSSEMEEFSDISLYKYFNTNSLWVNLVSLKAKLAKNPIFELPLIVNNKKVKGKSVIQLETAMGAAIFSFEKSKVLLVPRQRFIPVKKTNDLLSLWSDIYYLTQDYQIKRASKKLPKVELDVDFFGSIDQLQKKVKITPSLKDCKQFVVKCDYLFDKKEVFSGEVVLEKRR